MLLTLSIQQIALVDALRVDFSEGLNVLTGETGAGKSIVVDSVSLVLGGRADRSMIRTGADRATVRATFDVSGRDDVAACLASWGIEDADGLIEVSRELSRTGRNICRVNGALLPLNHLRELTEKLVDLHGQHEHQALLHPARHREFLDAFGDSAHQAQLALLRTHYDRYKQLGESIRALSLDAAAQARRADMLTNQIEEIRAAKLVPGEEASLNQLRLQLEHHEKIASHTRLAYERVYQGSGKSASAQEQLKRAVDAMQEIAPLSERFAQLSERLNELYIAVQDVGYELQDVMEGLVEDPQAAERVAERLDTIRRLERKYGPNIEDVLAFAERASAEWNDLTHSEARIQALTEEQQRVYDAWMETSKAVTASRHQLAETLCARIVRELTELGMAKVRFDVQYTSVAVPNAHGAEQIEFLLSPNPGEPVKPLADIASGGELSRIMLAMKNVAAEVDRVDTLIFDEIDTGVSGRMAQVVGEKMARIGRTRQVICVTHLPQIAALGDAHYVVEKFVEADRTGSTVRQLDESGRVMELARLVGGADGEANGRVHARHMREAAERWKQAHD